MKGSTILFLLMLLFFSTCWAIEQPLISENFDSLTPPQLPENWSVVSVTSPSNITWAVNTQAPGDEFPAHSTPNVAYINNGASNDGSADPNSFVGLATPQFNSGNYGCVLTLWVSGMNPLRIGIMSDLQDTTTFTELKNSYLDLPWKEVKAFIPPQFSGYVVFRHANWYGDHSLRLDDVVIRPLSTPVANLSENFDNVNPPLLPEDWFAIKVTDNLNSGASVKTDNADYYSSPNCLYLKNGVVMGQYVDPSAQVLAITPLLETAVNATCLTFKAIGQNPLKIGFMHDPTTSSAFEEITQINVNNSQWTEYTVNIPIQSNGFIAFKHANQDANTWIRVDQVSFATVVTQPVLTLDENFDNVTLPALPVGWNSLLSVAGSNNVASVQSMTCNAPTQPNGIFIMNGLDTSNGQPDASAFVALVSPYIHVPIQGAVLNFQATSTIPLTVGMLNNPAATQSFSILQNCELTSDWTQYQINLPAGNYYLAFKSSNLLPCTPIFVDAVTMNPNPDPVALTEYSENFDTITCPALPANWYSLKSVLPTNNVAAIQSMPCDTPNQPNAVFLMNGLDGSIGQPDQNAFVALLSPLTQTSDFGANLSFTAKGFCPMILGGITDPLDLTTFTLWHTQDITSEWTNYSLSVPANFDGFIVFKHGNTSMCSPSFVDQVVLTANQPQPPVTQFSASFDEVTAPALPENWFSLKNVIAANTVAAVQSMPCDAPSQPNACFIMNGLNTQNGQPDQTAFVALVSPNVTTPATGSTLTFSAKSTNGIQFGSLTNPFSSDSFALWQGINLTSDWAQYSVTIPPNFTGYLCLKNNNQSAVTPIFVDNLVLTPNTESNVSVESFENTLFPPTGWTVDNNTWHRSDGIGFAYEGIAYAEIFGNVGGKLKTPVLNISSTDSLVFFSKNNSWQNTPLSIKASSDGIVWDLVATVQINNTWQRFAVSLDSLAGLKQLAFEKNPTDLAIYYLDHVIMPEIFQASNDLAVTSLTYPENFYRRENTELTAILKVANFGSQNISNAVLNILIDENQLANLNLETIVPQDTLDVAVTITLPAGRGFHNLTANVIYEDENPVNNHKTVPIRYFGTNQMVEGFNQDAFPPAGWNSTGGWERYDDIGAYHNEHSNWVVRILGNDTGLLSTPLMRIVAGDSLSFFSENIILPDGSFQGDVTIKYSTDNTNWNDLTTVTPQGWPYKRYAVDLSSIAGDKYLGFFKTVDGAIYLDYIVGPDYAPQSENDPANPAKTTLAGNYPNPFNPSTTIKFDLKNQDKVTIEIFNIKGQKVKTLVNGTVSSGSHKVVWNGLNDQNRTVSGGVYFLKMKCSDYNSVRKMILIK